MSLMPFCLYMFCGCCQIQSIADGSRSSIKRKNNTKGVSPNTLQVPRMDDLEHEVFSVFFHLPIPL